MVNILALGASDSRFESAVPDQVKMPKMRAWCSGSTKPFQGLSTSSNLVARLKKDKKKQLKSAVFLIENEKFYRLLFFILSSFIFPTLLGVFYNARFSNNVNLNFTGIP